MNKCDDFYDESFTLLLDAFPIYIQRPSSRQRWYYSGKYSRHVVKVQIYCDNLGNIVWYGEKLWKGKYHDMKMFRRSHPLLLENEHVLADKGYCGRSGQEFGLVTPIKKRRGSELTAREKAKNYIHSYYRIVVEHAIGILINHLLHFHRLLETIRCSLFSLSRKSSWCTHQSRYMLFTSNSKTSDTSQLFCNKGQIV